MSDEHERLLKQVVDLELRMFLALEPAIPSACQEQPQTFKLMRKGSHYVLSEDTLKSYLADLEEAVDENRNLMALKYARIDNLIPPLSENPLIDTIVEIEGRWLAELAVKYPLTFKGRSDYAAGVYLRSELETYSPATLELYYRDLSRASDEGRNLTEERYTCIFRETGYESIDEMEKERAAAG
ncbi:MAG: DUF4125 family protein [Dehalococcoidia bacterium]|nr:DUF4125 family protein [Dehalococcoidia bacterium]